MKKITKKAVKEAIKIIQLYGKENPRRFPECTIIHEKDCELGLAHGRCYCTRNRETRLNYELDNVLKSRKL